MKGEETRSPSSPWRETIALVTGAASGIGHAVAALFKDEGMVVGALDRDPGEVPEGCVPLCADVREPEAVKTAIATFAEPYGRLDVLVNNAGISFVGTVEDGTEEDWQRVIDINLCGQMRVLRASLPWLRKSAAASVVIMSSCSALNGLPQRALYSASKGAVEALSHAVAADLVREGIRVNSLSPGTVRTPFMERIIARAADPEAKRREFAQRQPTGKMVEPGEVARAALFLADPRNASLTGTTLAVDGGMGSLRLPRED